MSTPPPPLVSQFNNNGAAVGGVAIGVFDPASGQFVAMTQPLAAGGNITEYQTDIAAGAALSASVELDRRTLVGIIMPAAWTAAVLTMQASGDGSTWHDIYDELGNESTLQVAAGRAVRVHPAFTRGWAYLRLRSGTGAAPVNQVAAVTLTVLVEYLP